MVRGLGALEHHRVTTAPAEPNEPLLRGGQQRGPEPTLEAVVDVDGSREGRRRTEEAGVARGEQRTSRHRHGA